jgi:hypothetical protein
VGETDVSRRRTLGFLALTLSATLCVPVSTTTAEDRGWFPPTLFIECAGDPSECVPVAAGQDIVLAIVQRQGNVEPVSGAQFGLAFWNAEPTGLVAVNGFTNDGTVTSPILIPPPGDPCLFTPDRTLAELSVRLLDPTAFRVCFTASDQAGVSCSMLCPSGAYVAGEVIGYRYGLPPCSDWSGLTDCLDPLPVESMTWGRAKSAYR